MRRQVMGTALLTLILSTCQDDGVIVLDDNPAAPRAVAASYYAGVVTVTWELAPGWNGESFRVYSRRVTDSDFFFIAEVTSCAAGLCSYEDANVAEDQTYEYYVSAVTNSGAEAASEFTVDVFVPQVTPPPVPDLPKVISLDDANFLNWGLASRTAQDFSHYRVYVADPGGDDFLLGETDSEGFLDLLAANGNTYDYFVSAVDVDGHESGGSLIAAGTPRPDFHGEWIYNDFDQPTQSAFRFPEDEGTYPIIDGGSANRHFRFEVDVNGWWLVPGPGTEIHEAGVATTALKCGVAADAGCVDVSTAPASGYTTNDVAIAPDVSYVFRVIGDDGLVHFGVIRVIAFDVVQNSDEIMIFDWAYQLQPGNPSLVSPAG